MTGGWHRWERRHGGETRRWRENAGKMEMRRWRYLGDLWNRQAEPVWRSGAWGLGSGVWDLGSGVWGLGSGAWGLVSGVWCLGSGVRGLRSGVWCLGSGVRGLGSGAWGQAPGVWCLGSGVWGLGSGAWGLVSEVWCLGSGAWCLGSGAWCQGSGVWCRVSGVWCLVSGVRCLVSGVWGLVSGVWGLGSGAWGQGPGVWGLVSGVWGQGSGFRGLGLGAWGLVSEYIFSVSALLVYDRQTLFNIRLTVDILSERHDLGDRWTSKLPPLLSDIPEYLRRSPAVVLPRKKRYRRRGKCGGALVRLKAYLASTCVTSPDGCYVPAVAGRLLRMRDRWLRPVFPDPQIISEAHLLTVPSSPRQARIHRGGGGVDFFNLRPLDRVASAATASEDQTLRLALFNESQQDFSPQ
ncbi:hypothetical protein PO909_016600 [Leuciscus waleckii]